MAPQLIFGTASFGMDGTEFQDVQSVSSVLEILQTLGIHRLDTAARYPPLNQGRSEALLGEAIDKSKHFQIDTKILTRAQTDGSGDLQQGALERSIEESLQRLQRPGGVNVLYSHRADPKTPLEEQIQGFNNQISQSHCQAWGVSNTPPDVLEKMLQLCEQNGWEKPRYYQGSYNVITRGMESKLLPILREHGISFIAYQSLAAGFLSGKLVNKQHANTRFDDANPLGKALQSIFGGEELHSAVKDFDAAVRLQGLTPLEVAIRWISHHSVLNDQDGIIIGASNSTQISETVALIQKGRLPDEILPLVGELWDAVKTKRGEVI